MYKIDSSSKEHSVKQVSVFFNLEETDKCVLKPYSSSKEHNVMHVLV